MQASVSTVQEDDVDREYRAEAAKNRFGQQISYGVGAAMVFGLFSGAASALFGAAKVAAAHGV